MIPSVALADCPEGADPKDPCQFTVEWSVSPAAREAQCRAGANSCSLFLVGSSPGKFCVNTYWTLTPPSGTLDVLADPNTGEERVYINGVLLADTVTGDLRLHLKGNLPRHMDQPVEHFVSNAKTFIRWEADVPVGTNKKGHVYAFLKWAGGRFGPIEDFGLQPGDIRLELVQTDSEDGRCNGSFGIVIHINDEPLASEDWCQEYTGMSCTDYWESLGFDVVP